MPTTCREMLAEINAWAYAMGLEHTEVKKLWTVLTALRGPDDGGDKTKYQSTSIIRRVALPFSKEHTCPVNTKGAEINLTSDSSSHFNSHILAAAEALDIPFNFRSSEEWQELPDNEDGDCNEPG